MSSTTIPGPSPRSARRRVRALGVAATLAAGAGALCLGGDAIDDTRTTIEKWVETKRLISEERLVFARSKETLNDRVALVEGEIASLREKIADTGKTIGEAEAKVAELRAENEALRSATASLEDAVVALEARTRELLVRVPEPVGERLKPLSQRIPQDGAETKLTLAERFQNVIGILNELNKANAEITVVSEVRELPDGSSASVTALYLGIAKGYYVNGDGTVAGVGHGHAEGWRWVPDNAAAPDIARAIAILKNEQVAGFVKLPVSVE